MGHPHLADDAGVGLDDVHQSWDQHLCVDALQDKVDTLHGGLANNHAGHVQPLLDLPAQPGGDGRDNSDQSAKLCPGHDESCLVGADSDQCPGHNI